MGLTMQATPAGKDQGLSCSATVSGGGAAAMPGWSWQPGKGCHPLACAADRRTHAGSRQVRGLHPGAGRGRNRAAARVADAPHLQLLGVAGGLAAGAL